MGKDGADALAAPGVLGGQAAANGQAPAGGLVLLQLAAAQAAAQQPAQNAAQHAINIPQLGPQHAPQPAPHGAALTRDDVLKLVAAGRLTLVTSTSSESGYKWVGA